MMRRALLVLFLLSLPWMSAHAFEIYSTEPADGAVDVDPTVAIQFFVDEVFDAKSVTRETVQLLDATGKAIAVVLTPDLGGAVTVAPEKPLQPKTKYTLKVGALKSENGTALQPFEGVFWTSEARMPSYENEPRLKRERIDSGEGYVSCAIGPDGNLYVTTWTGTILRLQLDPKNGGLKKKEKVFEKSGARILALWFDPQSSIEEPICWISYDDNGGASSSPGKFTSSVARLTFTAKGKLKDERLFITGLPNGAHPLNSGAFGPDGKLYLAQGSMTHLGGGIPPLAETPLSAAILVADVRNPNFGGGQPVHVDTSQGYDPTKADAPVKVYANGVRVAFDLCWHSNGQLYVPVNMNDTAAATPANAPDGLPVLKNVQPEEALLLIKPGKYYGHPNPTLNKWVLMGGNPTAERDAWEITKYPIGTKPDPDFDPALLLVNLGPLGGASANGCCEFTADGPLKGRLLVCFYTTARTVHTFTPAADGSRIAAHAPLIGEDGRPLKFGAPLDICMHPNGRLYVTDFQDKRRGDSGQSGGVWLLRGSKD